MFVILLKNTDSNLLSVLEIWDYEKFQRIINCVLAMGIVMIELDIVLNATCSEKSSE